MPEQLQDLLKELDYLLEIQSQALERLSVLPSHRTLEQVHQYEDRIDTLLAEICAIGRNSKKHN